MLAGLKEDAKVFLPVCASVHVVLLLSVLEYPRPVARDDLPAQPAGVQHQGHRAASVEIGVGRGRVQGPVVRAQGGEAVHLLRALPARVPAQVRQALRHRGPANEEDRPFPRPFRVLQVSRGVLPLQHRKQPLEALLCVQLLQLVLVDWKKREKNFKQIEIHNQT